MAFVGPVVHVNHNETSNYGWAQQWDSSTPPTSVVDLIAAMALNQGAFPGDGYWLVVVNGDGVVLVDNTAFQTDYTIIVYDPNA